VVGDQHGDLRLLFVAHRQEILRQSVGAFRQVLRSGDFGQLYVDGHRPDEWRHVFASIQSLAQVELAQLDPAAFDVVIVDEFHHAAAPTYRRLLEHLFGGAKADSAGAKGFEPSTPRSRTERLRDEFRMFSSFCGVW
jgi:superfamily II DNA or RNA helicase